MIELFFYVIASFLILHTVVGLFIFAVKFREIIADSHTDGDEYGVNWRIVFLANFGAIVFLWLYFHIKSKSK